LCGTVFNSCDNANLQTVYSSAGNITQILLYSGEVLLLIIAILSLIISLGRANTKMMYIAHLVMGLTTSALIISGVVSYASMTSLDADKQNYKVAYSFFLVLFGGVIPFVISLIEWKANRNAVNNESSQGYHQLQGIKNNNLNTEYTKPGNVGYEAPPYIGSVNDVEYNTNTNYNNIGTNTNANYTNTNYNVYDKNLNNNSNYNNNNVEYNTNNQYNNTQNYSNTNYNNNGNAGFSNTNTGYNNTGYNNTGYNNTNTNTGYSAY